MPAFYLFRKTPIAVEQLPSELLVTSKRLRSQTGDQHRYLELAFAQVISQYRGGRVETFLKIWQLWSRGVSALLARRGYLHCTNQNYILACLLIAGGLFEQDDIRTRWTQIWFMSPHQYLQVRIKREWIDVDPWSYYYGLDIGSHSHGFNASSRRLDR